MRLMAILKTCRGTTHSSYSRCILTRELMFGRSCLRTCPCLMERFDHRYVGSCKSSYSTLRAISERRSLPSAVMLSTNCRPPEGDMLPVRRYVGRSEQHVGVASSYRTICDAVLISFVPMQV